MADIRSLNPEWPAHFRNLCREVCGPQDARSHDRARGGLWLLLNSLISQYLRFHITRQGRVPVEDLEDIAAEKSLDLLRRIESETWDPVPRPTEEITGFLSKVARNGLVDRLRAIGRRIELAGEDPAESQIDSAARRSVAETMSIPDPPDRGVERGEFVAALHDCVSAMEARSRLTWFFRVLCGMSSKEIAAHPRVLLKASHVDVLLQRSRHAMRDCMRRKGYEPSDMPPGSFAEAWRACHLDQLEDLTGESR
jgi:DNA-directed RNA polymerase specialized sigma24 family protein